MAAGGNNRSRLLLVILLVTSLFLITLDLRGVNITSNSRSAAQSFLAPIQRGVSDLFSPVGNFFSDIKNFGKTKSELKELKEENAKLREKVVFNDDTLGQLKKLENIPANQNFSTNQSLRQRTENPYSLFWLALDDTSP